MAEPGLRGFAETDSLISPREPPALNPSPLSAGVTDVPFCFNTGDLNSDTYTCMAVTLPTELFPISQYLLCRETRKPTVLQAPPTGYCLSPGQSKWTEQRDYYLPICFDFINSPNIVFQKKR